MLSFGVVAFGQKMPSDYFQEAVDAYTKLLNGGQNELEPLGGSIMADPYTNFRHRAATMNAIASNG